MKIALILVLFSSSVIGVFADTDKVESVSVSVSVMEGDSVTLHTGVTKIQGSDEIEWRFNGTRMATIDSDSIFPDESFRDTMQLSNTTGDLKITNVTTADSGPYKLQITSGSGSPEIIFSVTVVISSGVKSVSVTEGDSVTLRSGVNGLQRDDVIRWRHQNILIAEIINETPSIYTYNSESLKLDKQTGSLTITDIKTEHAGDYEVDVTISISSSKSRYTIHKSFSVNVSDELKSVMKGDSVTLNSGLTEIQRDNIIRWCFKKTTLIAEIIKSDDRFLTYDDVLDGRFRGRLKLDHQTGSLNITNLRNRDSGDYEVEISTNRFTVHKRISVTVNVTVMSVLVMEGDSVTLHTGAPIPRHDAVLLYGDNDTLITDSVDARWSNTDQNNPTRDLTIRNIRGDQSGDYKIVFTNIQMLSMRIHRKFHINITGVFSDETDGVKTVSVIKGDSVFLITSVTEIQKGDLIEWLFGPQNITIAKTDGKNNSICNENDVRFKNRLNLNNQTGDLTINNSNIEHSGHYQLKIINNNTYTIQKSFSVTVIVPDVGLSTVAVVGIPLGVLLSLLAAAAVLLIYCCCRSSKKKMPSEVNGQNQTSNKDVETELTEPPKAAEQQQFI